MKKPKDKYEKLHKLLKSKKFRAEVRKQGMRLDKIMDARQEVINSIDRLLQEIF